MPFARWIGLVRRRGLTPRGSGLHDPARHARREPRDGADRRRRLLTWDRSSAREHDEVRTTNDRIANSSPVRLGSELDLEVGVIDGLGTDR